ncbi:MAG: hypothetical protein ACI8SE_000034 [Bacteroidia bacterium]
MLALTCKAYFCVVNFLSHYYFDSKPERPYFNMGLIFPDIVRNFVRGSKLDFTIQIKDAPFEHDLLKGCIQHVQSDKTFHAWSGFINAMDYVTKQIRQSPDDLEKDWFIAHILVELAMDHYLLTHNPYLAKNLYNDFETVDSVHVHSFLARHDFSKFDLFQMGFDRFMKVRYLESYTEPDNIVYALGRICTKMKLPPFSEVQKQLLKTIVKGLNEQMPNMVDELKVELK